MSLLPDDLKNTGCFSDIDIHLAEFLARTGGEDSGLFRLMVMMLSSRLDSGDICLSLDEIAGRPLPDFFEDDESSPCCGIIFPGTGEMLEVLRKSRAVGEPGSFLPLIIEENSRLYFQKYNIFENLLAEYIRNFSLNKTVFRELSAVAETFSLLFRQEDDETDWQGVAAYSALAGGITVISGGPGTGKTSTVVKILALVIESALKSGIKTSIALAAPTGKAAAKLRESVNMILPGLKVSDDVKRLIPRETYTIHRLLGSVKDSHEFRCNRENPLPHDVVVVDECSMGDMALMFRLVQAVKPGSRLILLGDRDQLSSVEGGSVFGDICAGAEGKYSETFLGNGRTTFGINFPAGIKSSTGTGMNDSLVVLRKSYRFSRGSGIGLLADMIRNGDASAALGILDDESYGDVRLADVSSGGTLESLYSEIASPILAGSGGDAGERISGLINRFSVLTATVKGKSGAEGMNLMAEDVLFRMGIINPAEKFYDGRPVMVTTNDYSLSLFNGDVGITSGGGTRIVFPGIGGEPRTVHPSRLPGHVTAFAMTIHKSQGSEFDSVLIVMPVKWNRVMTRELVYTAVTRARKELVIVSDRCVLQEMIKTPTKRMSGLKEKLRFST